jgi:hypothetical protein
LAEQGDPVPLDISYGFRGEYGSFEAYGYAVLAVTTPQLPEADGPH